MTFVNKQLRVSFFNLSFFSLLSRVAFSVCDKFSVANQRTDHSLSRQIIVLCHVNFFSVIQRAVVIHGNRLVTKTLTCLHPNPRLVSML